MTYKLHPGVRRIKSPVVLHIIGEETPDRCYPDGTRLSMEEFHKNYMIDSIAARGNSIIVSIRENEGVNSLDWLGEGTAGTSFF